MKKLIFFALLITNEIHCTILQLRSNWTKIYFETNSPTKNVRTPLVSFTHIDLANISTCVDNFNNALTDFDLTNKQLYAIIFRIIDGKKLTFLFSFEKEDIKQLICEKFFKSENGVVRTAGLTGVLNIYAIAKKIKSKEKNNLNIRPSAAAMGAGAGSGEAQEDEHTGKKLTITIFPCDARE